MIIKLRGVTRHGKNRIREHGDEWRIIKSEVIPVPVQLFIESVRTGDRRWLNHNFEIVEE